jgi:hypothetical protein
MGNRNDRLGGALLAGWLAFAATGVAMPDAVVVWRASFTDALLANARMADANEAGAALLARAAAETRGEEMAALAAQQRERERSANMRARSLDRVLDELTGTPAENAATDAYLAGLRRLAVHAHYLQRLSLAHEVLGEMVAGGTLAPGSIAAYTYVTNLVYPRTVSATLDLPLPMTEGGLFADQDAALALGSTAELILDPLQGFGVRQRFAQAARTSLVALLPGASASDYDLIDHRRFSAPVGGHAEVRSLLFRHAADLQKRVQLDVFLGGEAPPFIAVMRMGFPRP